FLTTEVTVDAMRLGAADVLEKPVTIEHLRGVVLSLLGDRSSEQGTGPRTPGIQPRSAAERWAIHVLKACGSDHDLTTVGEWAAYVGLSRTSLDECCQLAGVHPLDARDLMRLLRALRQAGVEGCPPETLLLVSDRRTLRKLLERGGLANGDNGV